MHKATGCVHGIATLTCRTLRSQPVRTPQSLLGAQKRNWLAYFVSTVTAQPNILAAKALSFALAAASASLHAVKASRISLDFGSSLLAASRSALAAA